MRTLTSAIGTKLKLDLEQGWDRLTFGILELVTNRPVISQWHNQNLGIVLLSESN